MNIEIGPSRYEVEFDPGNERTAPLVRFRWRETGGYDGGPTGQSFSWWFDPNSLPRLVEQLNATHAEYLAWVEVEKARYAALDARG